MKFKGGDNVSNAQKILAATHSTLIKVRDLPLVGGMVNSAKIAFQFRTADWDDTIKTAAFAPGDVHISTEKIFHVLLDENNECIVPYEVLNGNSFSVSVFGTKNGYTMSSEWINYKNNKGSFSNGIKPADPTPTIYEQLLDKINKSGIAGSEEYYTKEEINKLLGMVDDETFVFNGQSIIEEEVES